MDAQVAYETEAQVVEAFDGTRQFAEAIGVSHTRVCNWIHTGFPPNSWPEIVEAATARGLPVSYEMLAAFRRKRNRRLLRAARQPF